MERGGHARAGKASYAPMPRMALPALKLTRQKRTGSPQSGLSKPWNVFEAEKIPRPDERLVANRSRRQVGRSRMSSTLPAAGRRGAVSRRLGCGACTKSPGTHPKRGRLGSSSMLARRRQERALHRRELGGLSPLQTMYQLPNHQQRQRLPHHSQQSQSGVHTSGKHCL
jgi:hypothetical protein